MYRFCVLLSLSLEITILEWSDNVKIYTFNWECRKYKIKIIFLHEWTTHWTRTYTQLE